jgi:GNAT superfamily N-acetyltransferase
MIQVRPIRDDERAFVDERLPLSRLDQPGGEYLVAWLDREPIGHAHLDWAADPPELQDVFVLEAERRRGVASELTAAAENRVRERGHDRLHLEAGLANPAARTLYEKLGYRRTDDPPRRVQGTILIRGEPLEVDDTLLRFEKTL